MNATARRITNLLALALVVPLIGGCTDWLFARTYAAINTGKLSGKIIVEWIDQDKFIFVPDPQNPLTFTRKNKKTIVPQRMYTDGGSVPAALRAIKSYSPWGYAPAFIIHDWLFVMKQCGLPGAEDYDLDEAATVMAEVMKTVMENPKYGGANKLVLYSMYEAVRSRTARDYWENGKCETPSGRRFVAPKAVSENGATRSFARKAQGRNLPRFEISF